jgi:hypothetical protein
MAHAGLQLGKGPGEVVAAQGEDGAGRGTMGQGIDAGRVGGLSLGDPPLHRVAIAPLRRGDRPHRRHDRHERRHAESPARVGATGRGRVGLVAIPPVARHQRQELAHLRANAMSRRMSCYYCPGAQGRTFPLRTSWP